MLCQVRFGEYWRSQGAHPSTTSFQHGVVLYCQAEPRSRDIVLFYRNSTIIFVPGIEKIALLSSQSQNNYTKISSLIGNFETRDEIQLGDLKPCWPAPHTFLPV
jgi:hypothetical protein